MRRQNFAKFEFVEANGERVPAHRFTNPDGSIGGWVADDATVEAGAYVEMGAFVPPGSKISKIERIVAEKIISIESV